MTEKVILPVETVLKYIETDDQELLTLVHNCTKVTFKGIEIAYRHDIGMFSLTHVWKACGSDKNKRPVIWVRQVGTVDYFKELLEDCKYNGINNLSRSDYNHLQNFDQLYITCHGGRGEYASQTFGVWEVLIAYLMYLDAKMTKEVIKVFKMYLTDKANLAIKIYKKLSQKDKDFVEARTTGKESRRTFTDKLQEYSLTPDDPMLYARCTNAIYKGLFGMDSQSILFTLSLPSDENPRDHLHIDNIRLLMSIEGNIADILDNGTEKKLSTADLEHICFDFCYKYKEAMHQIGASIVLEGREDKE